MNARARWGAIAGVGIGMSMLTPTDAASATADARLLEGRQEGRTRVLGKLEIRNGQWDAVRVEVRAGTAKNCDMNPLVGVRILARARAWEIASTSELCWRREANPGQTNSPFTSWQRTKPVPGRRRVVQP